MVHAFRFAVFAALALAAQTLWGDYLDSHSYSVPYDDGVWSYANGVLEGLPTENSFNTVCRLTVPGRGWLSFRWRVVNKNDETKVLEAHGRVWYDWDENGDPWSVYQTYACANFDSDDSDGWKNAKVAHREIEEGGVEISFFDQDYYADDDDAERAHGKIQIKDITWEDGVSLPTRVTLDPCGGTLDDGMATTFVRTSIYGNLPTPTRSGCTFEGWSESMYDTDYVGAETALPLESTNIVLYAHWTVPVEEALDPTGALRDEERGNRIDLPSSTSTSPSFAWDKDEGRWTWRGDTVEFYGAPTAEGMDLLRLYVHGCGTLAFDSFGIRYWSGVPSEKTAFFELVVMVDGKEVKTIPYKTIPYKLWRAKFVGTIDISARAGYRVDTDGLTEEDDNYDLHEVRLMVRTSDESRVDWMCFESGAIRWTEATGTQTVAFDARGGSATGARTYAIGGTYGSLPTLTRAAATFMGWFTAPEGGEKILATDLVRPSVTTLYARWTATLAAALGTTPAFTSTSWVGTADVSRANDTSFSAAATDLRAGVTNVLSTTVEGRGIVAFWWRQGLQPFDGDLPTDLALWVDGQRVAEYGTSAMFYTWRHATCTTSNAWKHVSYAIPNAGTHTIEWRYTPGGSEADGALDLDSWSDLAAYKRTMDGVAVLAPGAWVQDVSWKPAGENDYVTWVHAVTEGRSWLKDELPTIETAYTAALADDPNDYETRILRAFTKVTRLFENKNLLAVLGKFGQTPDYGHLVSFFGEFDYSAAPLANDLVDAVVAEVEPALKSALADLEAIPETWTGTILLSTDAYHVDENTRVDIADILFLRASANWALAMLALAQSYDLSLDYAKIDDYAKIKSPNTKAWPTIQQIVNDHPAFMESVRSPARLQKSKAFLREALQTLQRADKRVLARTADDLHFFEYDRIDEEGLQLARDEGEKMLTALDATVTLTDDDFTLFARKHPRNYRFTNLNQTVSLKPFFKGVLTRAILGTQFNAQGEPLLDSFPDVTLGGILPGMTKTRAVKWGELWGLSLGPVSDTEVAPQPEDPADDGYVWNYICGDLDGELDLSVAQVYDACLYGNDGNVAGSVQVKAAKAKRDRKTGQTTAKVTATIQIAGEKKITATGTLNVADGGLTLTTRDGRELTLELGSNGVLGTFDGYELDGARNVFSTKVKTEAVSATALVNTLKEQGAIGIVWEDEATGGLNTLSVTMATKGKAKVTGTLANGTRVSVQAQMIVGEEVCCIPVAYSKKNVTLSFGLWISSDGTRFDVTGLGDGVVAGFVSGPVESAVFSLDVDGLSDLLGDGLYEDLLPKDLSFTVTGTRWTLPKAGRVVVDRDGEIDKDRAGTNPSGLKLSYKAKTGMFTGSFKAYTNVKGKPKATTVSISGIVVDGVGYGMATVRKAGSVAVSIE